MTAWCQLRFLLSSNTCLNILARHKTIDHTTHLISRTQNVELSQKKSAQRFVDYKRVVTQGGNGGDGCMSFLSVFAKEFAGPDGGDGGNGGHVIFQADNNTKSLSNVETRLIAESGAKGQNKNCNGKNAPHLFVKVPCGTIIKDEAFAQLTDLQNDGEIFIGARGGGGGKGNHFFKTSIDTAPTSYEEGGRGQCRNLHVELRVIAHVGLVGFPNAGKSTLLRALSKARPKVAAYPFTTLKPHIGIIEYDDCEQVAVADIPGLIPGAHENLGLGFSFLKHIRRCVCLLYVIDLSDDDPYLQFETLKYELEQYEQGLSNRPHAIIANKLDLEMAEENLSKFQEKVGNVKIFPISAKYKVDIDPLFVHIKEIYENKCYNI